MRYLNLNLFMGVIIGAMLALGYQVVQASKHQQERHPSATTRALDYLERSR